MKRMFVITAVTAAGLALAGLAQASTGGNAGQTGANETQMFLTAPVSLNQAGQIALKAQPGQLAAVGFNDENGAGVYEASVVAKDGSVNLLKIDAQSGKILKNNPVQSIGNDGGDGDHEMQDGAGNGHDNQQDGEQQNG